MSPKLSIIIPLYNKEEYVERCVESVLSQDFTNYELIIVNDGSTDKSAAIIEKIFSDSSLRLISLPNKGVSVARNRGLREATGEYILFIDADDYISPHYLSNIIAASTRHEADLYVWGITKEVSKGVENAIVPRARGLYDHDKFIHEMITEQYGENLGIMGYVCNKMTRRDIIENNHIRFDTSKTLMEDYDFYLQYYRHIRSAYFFAETGYHYAWHPSSAEKSEMTVDYASLIDTHRRCMTQIDKLSATSGSDYRKVLESVGHLSLAMFLEMRPVTLSNVESHLQDIAKRPYCKKALEIINTNKPSLCKWIGKGSKLSVYLYLKMWRLYLRIRRIHR